MWQEKNYDDPKEHQVNEMIERKKDFFKREK